MSTKPSTSIVSDPSPRVKTHRSPPTCFACGSPGHLPSTCPKPGPEGDIGHKMFASEREAIDEIVKLLGGKVRRHRWITAIVTAYQRAQRATRSTSPSSTGTAPRKSG